MYCAQLTNYDMYYMYAPMVDNGVMDINTADINSSTFIQYFDGLMNIFRDGIECDEVQRMRINLIFSDGLSVRVSIFDYYFNLILWRMFIDLDIPIKSSMFFFPENITQDEIKDYIDNEFLDAYRDEFNLLNSRGYDPESASIIYNQCIDNSMYGLSFIDEFAMYLMNTINLKDDIDLGKKVPRFRELLHSDLSNVPIDVVKEEGIKLTLEAIDIIKNSDHCLADSFKAEQGINTKQYKEYLIHEGPKPNGRGGLFPHVINSSFVNGGVADLASFLVESSSGRLAQIIAKCNVGTSGAFARILGLNNRDTILHPDPNYTCDSKNFQVIVMKDASYLYSFKGRYYRKHPLGMEYCLSTKDTHLIGEKLYFRSPMKCASMARGEGICYRCYGKLAYVNASINIGQYAASNLSAKLTQKQLSAKHILEAAMIALVWNEHFDEFLNIEFNTITLKENFDYTDYHIIINPNDIQLESEDDDYSYNEYLTLFSIRTPDGKIFPIYTANKDQLYISNDLNNTIRLLSGDVVDGTNLAIPMSAIPQDSVLFLVHLTNNEFSATLNKISNVINLEAVTTSYDTHQLLQEFNDTVKEGKLGITSVHLEVILANQLRNKDNILRMPDWTVENEDCEILTLNRALTNNPSITVSLMYKMTNAYYNPLSFAKNKPSILDLLFMEKPQEFFQNDGLYNKPKYEPISSKPTQLIRRVKND